MEQIFNSYTFCIVSTYQRSFYHVLELFWATLTAHLSQNLFLAMKISVIDPLYELWFWEILSEINKPTTWHLDTALYKAMLCNLRSYATLITLNHHYWLLVMYSFTKVIQSYANS